MDLRGQDWGVVAAVGAGSRSLGGEGQKGWRNRERKQGNERDENDEDK